jgi:hypothetical protein
MFNELSLSEFIVSSAQIQKLIITYLSLHHSPQVGKLLISNNMD